MQAFLVSNGLIWLQMHLSCYRTYFFLTYLRPAAALAFSLIIYGLAVYLCLVC